MNKIKPWIVAARLRTLPLAISGIIVGTSLASNKTILHNELFWLTLLTAFLLQILSNFANDYGDAVSGVDSDHRKGPDRMVQTGVITKSQMKNALVITIVLTFVSGVGLLFLAFSDDLLKVLIFLIIGIAAIAAAIKYTVGKNPYGYAGFGDLFVFLFFGIVAVEGTYFLQTKAFDWMVLLPASSLGFFSINVLNVNNIRDIESDKVSGKQSIPVRLGRKKAVFYHGIILLSGVVCSLIFVFQTYRSWLAFLFLPVTIIFIINYRAVAKKPADQLDPYLKQMAISTLLFSILFAVGQGISWFF